ncbi:MULTISPECIES: hypothetical protein [unclassified Myxococcus]|uniref:hypothetical protein n=1 Tax=unclassified Myxococcus TaxID=2648731 RepID=UPI00157B4910|nr:MULTISPECIES: hypothetical protein [unclassified Myxococcus]NTX33803.1 hypothetical protein [Myxococcus sp. CA033]NTX49824.1 hypothetical protein [Myxococcus sp. CA039A]
MSDASRHLDARSWKALRDKSPEEVAYFSTHLSQPCEVCEAFLERSDEDDAFGVESLADEALGSMSTPREDAVGWARLRRRLGTPRRAWLAGALAVAAAAVVAIAVLPPLASKEHEDRSWRLKGVAPMSLELTAVARLPDGTLHAVTEDALLPPEAVVLVRYRASEVSDAMLVLESPEGPAQMLGGYTLEAGTHDLKEAGELAGVSLAGEHGPRVLVLAAWPRGPRSAAERDTALTQSRVPEEAAQARLRLRVEPGYVAP